MSESLKRKGWSVKSDFRIKNRKWLRYSSNIARRILAAIESKDNFSQADLARSLGVSQQHISEIVKGRENLTLKTIATISEALNTELIAFPDYKYSNKSTHLQSLVVSATVKWSGKQFDFAMSPAFFNSIAAANLERPLTSSSSEQTTQPNTQVAA